MGFIKNLWSKKQSLSQKEAPLAETQNLHNKKEKEEATPYKFDGVKALQMGNAPLAIKFFEKALEIYNEFETRYYYSHALARSGNPREAIAQYSLLLEEVPNHYPALTERSELLLQENHAEEALHDALLAVENCETEEEKALCYRLLARIYCSLQQFEEANIEADKALAISKKDTTSALTKTEALIALNKTEEALAFIQIQKETFPEEERFLLLEAHIYEKEENSQKAIQLFEQTLEVDPFNEEAAIALVKIYWRDEQREVARNFLESFMEERNSSRNIKLLYASILRKEGEEEKAIAIEKELEDPEKSETVDFNNLYRGGIF